MRLLNTQTLQFAEFYDQGCPEYAILSHCWSGKETTLQDFERVVAYGNFAEKKDAVDWQTWELSPGIRKILRFSEITEYEWIWVDTCCIDKKSSAELGEAINSMLRWYRSASVCVVYLEDILPVDPPSSPGRKVGKGTTTSGREPADDEEENDEVTLRIRDSRWLTRGWTLQEMLIPRNLRLYDHDWNLIVEGDEAWEALSEVTGIELGFFGSIKKIMDAPVAERMSWAACRETSRTEDIAYCLMGLFGVNMPLLYGEGEKAFMRLQQEIIKINSDESIFVWEAEPPNLKDKTITTIGVLSGLFAEHPRQFRSVLGCHIDRFERLARDPFTMTHHGLELAIPDLELTGWASKVKEVELNCYVSDWFDSRSVALMIVMYQGAWCRIQRFKPEPTTLRLGSVGSDTKRPTMVPIYVKQVETYVDDGTVSQMNYLSDTPKNRRLLSSIDQAVPKERNVTLYSRARSEKIENTT